MTEIETERLLLRPIAKAQARAILAGEAPAGVQLADGYPGEFSLEVMDLLAGPRAGEADRFTPHFVIRRDSAEAIGEIGWSLAESEPETARIGYSIVEPQWGRGYATEAVRALLERLLEDGAIERVVADTLPSNAGSRRVLEKAGLAEAGTRLSVEDGETVEVVRYEARRAK